MIECLLVCVNYSDYLECVIENNKKQFDNLIVVTNKNDKETISLCAKYDIQYVLTDRIYEDNAKFNKGKAINDGIKNLAFNDWLLITDADMFFPSNFKDNIKDLDKECIYGTHRFMCPNYQDWSEFIKTNKINQNWVVQKHRLAIGVGFFQLVNVNSSIMNKLKPKWYSEDYGHAGRSDRIFLRNWPDNLRKKLNIDMIHLGSDELGKNWNGRTTDKWNK